MSLMKKQSFDWRLAAVIAALVFIGLIVFSLVLAALVGSLPLASKVGVVEVKGDLSIDPMSDYLTSTGGVRETIQLLKKADEDPEVSVILLDINSGGGTIVASKELMRAVLATEKPVVAYISEVGASGAYLVASGADEIVADEDSLTGSIGVVSEIQNYVGLMEKLGLNITLVTAGKHKSMLSPFEELDPADRAMLQAIIEEAYTSFRSDLLNNRPQMDESQFDAVADGRLLSGRQAYSAGLVDYLGSRDFALQRAAARGGISDEPEEKYFKAEAFSFSELFGQMGKSFGAGLVAGASSGVVVK